MVYGVEREGKLSGRRIKVGIRLLRLVNAVAI